MSSSFHCLFNRDPLSGGLRSPNSKRYIALFTITGLADSYQIVSGVGGTLASSGNDMIHFAVFKINGYTAVGTLAILSLY